jgi:dTDP-4-dehydrorhamnose 3,5-epimerase
MATSRRSDEIPALLFQKTRLKDAFIVDVEPRGDERGVFARTYCAKEFAAAGLTSLFVQQNMSSTTQKGTVRGMHLQRAPHAEAKLIRCTRGEIYDVIVDLRPDSPTYLQWEGFALSAANRRQVFVPQGFAHGFQTLTPDVEVSYLCSAYYQSDAEYGLRHDDPLIGIEWPAKVTIVSAKDQKWPDFVPDPSGAGA